MGVSTANPAGPLLAVAPWVLVRGSHELCSRGGHGWFHRLGPHPTAAQGVDTTPPYALDLPPLHLLIFDGADADDAINLGKSPFTVRSCRRCWRPCPRVLGS
jgi:hypothetical protein